MRNKECTRNTAELEGRAESQHARQWAGAHTALVTVSAVPDKGGEAMCT